MALFEINTDLGRVAGALERIAFLLEKLVFPPAPAEVKVHQATLDDLHTVTEEDVARMQTEQTEFAERFRVVPGSPAMMEALRDWELEQRNIHGQEWQAPEDWKALFAAAAGDREVREPAGTSAPSGSRSEA